MATARLRVQTRYVRRHAARAIFARIKTDASSAILSCDRDPANPRAVILHVNSGGNSLACEEALRAAGYHVEPAGHFGCQLRIAPATPGSSS